ncbi:MAG: tetratricopeptide repeat protein [Alistipes sp.]|nr:tetratricopeptide repeat protein [Alistipes sp.]
MFRRFIIAIALVVATAPCVEAMTITSQKVLLDRAESLLAHRRWSDARHDYLRLRESVPQEDVEAHQRVEYGLTLCAVHLDDNAAEQRMLDFLRRYPWSVYAADIHFQLALYYCEQEDFDKARKEFEQVPYRTLDGKSQERYDIRMGYIEFLSERLDKAYEYFDRIKPRSDYYDHAVYYKSYIQYHQGNYDKAYEGFASLSKSDAYSKVIPYYLLQIEFSRGNYRYVVRECDALIRTSTEAERLELMRIASESWYRLEGYSKALQYITMYKIGGGEMERDEEYILGYSAYRTADYATATEAFKKVCTLGDELGQNASYHLADCYLKQGNKRMAIYSFAMASADIYTNDIAEDALFNYGKLLFEMGGGTFNESINVLTRYVTRYPTSPRTAEARELLIAAYFNSHDYDAAYTAIRNFPSPDGNIKTALQKITYFKGLEAFSAGDMVKAKESLQESQQVGVSPKYKALGAFWLGEIAYKQGDYAEAISQYNYYVKRAPRTEQEYRMALYNLGYSHLAVEDISKARTSFEGFLWLYKERDGYRADAFNRLGDVLYLQKDYGGAVKNYEGAVSLNTSEQHYARFQRAISLGLQGKSSPKISALREIIKRGDGDFVDDASYELGRTYVGLERYAEGAKVLETFTAAHPASPYYIPAMLDMGLIYLNLGDKERSLKCYDTVITADPQSKASKDAMQSVREIYVAKGDVASYFAYAERAGVECDLSVMTRDSLSFRSAQNIYLAGRNQEALPKLEQYIKEFPKGYYLNDALFCLSDSYLKCDSLDRAVERMKLLADRPTNSYTRPVLEKLAEVTRDNNMHAESAKAWRRLYDLAEDGATRERMATQYVDATLADGYDDGVLAMAEDIALLQDVAEPVRRRSQFAKAGVLERQNDKAGALSIYECLRGTVSDSIGAESAYKVILSHYEKGDVTTAEEQIYAFSDSKTPHAYWLGKAFILLGTIYAEKGDDFQARATYQSIIDGYMPADDGVVAEAQQRLDALNR